jgi:hypothetical protein
VSAIAWVVPNDAFVFELERATVSPYLMVSFATTSVDHVITADWFVIDVLCTEEMTGGETAFCNVVKLNVPFVEQLPPALHAVIL